MAMLRKRILLRFSFVALIAGASLLFGCAGHDAHSTRTAIETKELTRGVQATGQISLDDIRSGRLHGVRTIIDLRPDGETPDQPSAHEVEQVATAARIRFHYIPVAPGAIPEGAIAGLQSVLVDHAGPYLLYCRSGSRATRTWALSEASRESGLDAATIRAAVAAAGFSSAEIDAAIDARVAARRPASR